MWVGIDPLVRCRDADLIEQFNGPFAGLLLGHIHMHQNGLGQLFGDGVQGVEAGQGILKDSADFFAANAPHLFVGKIINAFAFEQDFAPCNPSGGLKQADDRGTG